MNGNGKKPLEFAAPSHIPIVGQPFELCGWYLTAMLRCRCNADRPPVVIPQGAAGVCPACQTQYQIAGTQIHPTQGLAIQIAISRPGQVPDVPQESIGG